MCISELNELSVLRDENGRLKKLLTDLTLDKHILQEVLSKNSLKLAHLRGYIKWIREFCGIDVKHDC
jgi:putative transposase